jgi:hypothetical protein
MQGSEPLELIVADGDDELAHALDRDPASRAVRLELSLALAAQPRLERSRRVVEPGMHDAAVVA